MNAPSLIRLGGALLLGVTIGAAGMLVLQMQSWEKDLNQTSYTDWYNDGEAYLAKNDGETSISSDNLHLHDTYYVVADGGTMTGLAGLALVSIFLIGCAGPVGRRLQRAESTQG